MEQMRRVAFVTVLRACGFGSLAIFCLMMGMAFTPRSAFQTGGALTMLMTFVLVLKALQARTKRYSRTELWLYLAKEHRPPPASAQQLISIVMRETYLTFALWSSMIAIGMWSVALFFSFAGR